MPSISPTESLNPQKPDSVKHLYLETGLQVSLHMKIAKGIPPVNSQLNIKTEFLS